MSITAIFVTYRMLAGVVRNAAFFRKVFPNAQCIIIDNSPAEFKESYEVEKYINVCIPNALYIDNLINNRFVAYNIGVRLAHEAYTVFRTDDDHFNELHLKSVLTRIAPHPFVVTPHIYDGQMQFAKDHRRPIESAIFSTSFITFLSPFEAEAGSDWRLMKNAFEAVEPLVDNEVICIKKKHGRPTCH